MKPTIGKTEEDKDLVIDIPRLLLTRMLLEADSGGGKTVALKRIAEQTHGHVQQIMIDPEGEFSTLREKFDYLLCAPEGADAIANPKTAAILARKLRETRVSAVIDIYDLRPQEQKHFVRLFIEELLAAPKSLWNPCLLIIDEAQIFAPENDKAESHGAIMDLRGRGRKRGLCPILATPRLAELSKDACAGLQNKLIGVTTLDLDVKRAARDLSMTPTEATLMLRNLEPGEFFCFGPALTRTITKVRIGKLQTSHGQHKIGKDTRPPAPSEKIKDVIAKLTDLPKEAEQEARTLDDFKRENANLKRELTLARKEQPKTTEIKRVEVPVLNGKHAVAVQTAAAAIEKSVKNLKQLMDKATDISSSLERTTRTMFTTNSTEGHRPTAIATGTSMPARRREATGPAHSSTTSGGGGNPAAPDAEISRPQQRILDALASFDAMGVPRVRRVLVAFYSGASPRSSAFTNNLGSLRSAGLIIYPDSDHLALTTAGLHAAKPAQAYLTNEELHQAWLSKLPLPQRRILDTLIGIFPGDLSKESLAEKAGASPTSSAYTNNLGALRSLGAIDYPERGRVRATELLFPFGT